MHLKRGEIEQRKNGAQWRVKSGVFVSFKYVCRNDLTAPVHLKRGDRPFINGPHMVTQSKRRRGD